MAFFVYNKRDGHAVGPYETAQSFTADEERDVVIEMEIDFSTDYLPCFKLSEDGVSDSIIFFVREYAIFSDPMLFENCQNSIITFNLSSGKICLLTN